MSALANPPVQRIGSAERALIAQFRDAAREDIEYVIALLKAGHARRRSPSERPDLRLVEDVG